jgi:hypothetical protein
VRSLGLDTKEIVLERPGDLDADKLLLFLGTFPAKHVSDHKRTAAINFGSHLSVLLCASFILVQCSHSLVVLVCQECTPERRSSLYGAITRSDMLSNADDHHEHFHTLALNHSLLMRACSLCTMKQQQQPVV